MTNHPPPPLSSTLYRSYLVRFWQSAPQGDWRASAQCVQSGHTILFGNVERLLAFLHSEIKQEQPAAQPEQREDSVQ